MTRHQQSRRGPGHGEQYLDLAANGFKKLTVRQVHRPIPYYGDQSTSAFSTDPKAIQPVGFDMLRLRNVSHQSF